MRNEEEWSHPVFATREEFNERLRDVISLEQEDDLVWWYLSFATESGFLGGLYIPAHGLVEAAASAHALGLNPGGQVAGHPVGHFDDFDEVAPWSDRLRLLTKEELGWADAQ